MLVDLQIVSKFIARTFFTCNNCLIRATSDVYVTIFYNYQVFSRSKRRVGELVTFIHLFATQCRLGRTIHKHSKESRASTGCADGESGFRVCQERKDLVVINSNILSKRTYRRNAQNSLQQELSISSANRYTKKEKDGRTDLRQRKTVYIPTNTVCGEYNKSDHLK